MLVVLDGGNERVDSVMCLCAAFEGLVPSWLEVRVLSSSVCVVSRARRRPSKSLAKVSLSYLPL